MQILLVRANALLELYMKEFLQNLLNANNAGVPNDFVNVFSE